MVILLSHRENQSQPVKYFESVQIIRGIAVLLVLLAHATFYRPDLQLPAALRFLGGFPHEGVAAFFVISGFTLPWSLHVARYRTRQLPLFLSKRLVRLEPVYLVAVLFAGLVFYIQTRLPQFPGEAWTPTVRQIALHFLYLIPFSSENWLNPVFWTLGVEFQFYLLLGLLFPTLIAVIRRAGAILGVFVPVLLALPSIFPAQPQYSLSNFAALFALGLVVFMWHAKFLHAGAAVIGALATTAMFSLHNDPSSALASACTAAFVAFWTPRKNWLSTFGALSYSLYVLQLPVVWVVIRGGMLYFKTPGGHFLLWLAAIGISILIAALAHRFIERPSQALSKRIRYGNEPG